MNRAFALVCILASCSTEFAVSSSQGTGSPVEQVVQLLTDLKSKLEMDEKVEQQIYDKFACWCEKTTARKAKAIEDAQADMRKLGQKMLKLKGTIATLAAEIEELIAAIKANKEAQAEATALREKENAAWKAETDETKEALTALEQAIIVLRDATGGSALLQERTQARTAVKRVIDMLPTSVALKPQQEALLSEFASSKDVSKYTPQSVTIQGMLRDMYENFARSVQEATNTEATQNRNYEEFMEEKAKELADLEADKADKEEKKAKAEEDLADTTQEYDDTEAQMKADIEFFDETKQSCKEKHDEWVTRSGLRDEEIEGIAKAIEILSSDEARELFGSSIKAGKEVRADDSYKTGTVTSFLQKAAGNSAEGSTAAYHKLRDAARKTHSLRLAALAVRVQGTKAGHFDEVIAAIDEMIKTLKEEDLADIAKRDQCKDEYKNIASVIGEVTWLIEKNEAKIDKLIAKIEDLEAEKAKTIEEIEAVKAHMKEITKVRKEENEEFLKNKEDDQKVIKLLAKARTALTKYYKKNDIEMGPVQAGVKDALMQEDPEFAVSEDQAPEAVFSSKGKRKGESKGIVSIMTMLIEDVADEIKNAMKAEEEATLAWEEQMATAEKLKKSLITKKVNLEVTIAKTEDELKDEKADKKKNEGDLKDEEDYNASIKPDCDWMLKAFAERAEKRAAELDGLSGAKEYLVGYQPSLLERRATKAFDDDKLPGLKFLALQKH
jgi:hypothetical protein